MSEPLILVIDDDAMNREVMEAFLTMEDYRVALANSGGAGLQMAEQMQPDLIITDVRMPDMTGYEVCRRLKASPATAEIPVLIVTGFDSAEDRQQGEAAGADGFISRPFDGADFIKIVRMFIDN